MRNSKKDVMLHAMGNCQSFWHLFCYNYIEMYSYDMDGSNTREVIIGVHYYTLTIIYAVSIKACWKTK
jgi:hypothetical protein